MATNNSFVFDLDGVLVDSGHRLSYINSGMDRFFEDMEKDLIVEPIYKIIESLYKDYNIYLLTGRTNTMRKRTEHWLRAHYVPYDQLYMRPIGYDGAIAPMKCDVLCGLRRKGKIINGFFDDNPLTVQAAKELGFNAILIDSGYYENLPAEESALW